MTKTILVDARHILPDRMDGVGHFTQEICKKLPEIQTEWNWVFVHDRKIVWPFDLPSNVKIEIWSPPARLPILWKYWYFVGIPVLIRKYRADAFIGTMGWIPLKQKSTRCVSIVHDINFYHQPTNLHPWHRAFYRTFFPRFLRAADAFGFVSQFTLNDTCKVFPEIASKPHTLCYNAVSEAYIPLEDHIKSKVQKQFSGGLPYWIFIGTMIPRKNILNHIRSFEWYRKQSESRMKFLLLGKYDAMKTEIEEAIARSPYAEDIVLLGRVDEKTKIEVLGSAFAMLFLPHFEGFGIPLLEAMSCGTPVVASRASAIPEIGGEACLYADPDSVEEAAQQMLVLENETVRADFITLGKARAREFSWKTSAAKIVALLD